MQGRNKYIYIYISDKADEFVIRVIEACVCNNKTMFYVVRPSVRVYEKRSCEKISTKNVLSRLLNDKWKKATVPQLITLPLLLICMRQNQLVSEAHSESTFRKRGTEGM